MSLVRKIPLSRNLLSGLFIFSENKRKLVAFSYISAMFYFYAFAIFGTNGEFLTPVFFDNNFLMDEVSKPEICTRAANHKFPQFDITLTFLKLKIWV